MKGRLTSALHGSPLRGALLASIGILFASRIPLAHRININWDEFYYLSRVHDYVQGRLASALQNGHVHLFTWLTELGPTEVDQVVAGRLSYLLLSLGSALLLYRIARRFVTVEGSLFVVLCFTAYSELIVHGTSFRADGLAVFLLLLALFLVLGKYPSAARLLGAAACVAVSFLVTLKTVFWLPTLLAAIWLAPPDDRRSSSRLGRSSAFLAGAGILYALGFALHQAAAAPEALSAAAGRAGVAGAKVFTAGLFPRDDYLLLTLARNSYIWLCVVGGGFLIHRFLRRGYLRRPAALSLWALLLPSASVLIYRNAFPYYYVFVVPPALVLAGRFWDWLSDRALTAERRWAIAAPVILLVAVFVSGVVHVGGRIEDRTQMQRQVLRVVHELFPEPVPYIDRAGMVASFPRVGFFMSSWGLESYWERGEPVFEQLIREHQPAFILENTPVLDLDPESPELPPPYILLPEDRRVLGENYEPLWGPLYVPGKSFALAAGGRMSLDLLVGGTYVVYSSSVVRIGGQFRTRGDTIALSPGTLIIETPSVNRVRLMSATAKSASLPPPPRDQIFVAF